MAHALLLSEDCRKKKKRKIEKSVAPLFKSFDQVFRPKVRMERLRNAAGHLFVEKSFWKPRNTEPKNFFERLADEIFDSHTREKSFSTGGTEWWVQVLILNKLLT